MAPELIAQILNNACQDYKLNFQIVVQESILHIYINREIDSELDYTQLTNHITDSLITLDQTWEGFWLYSRIMGEVEPDWQTYVELPVDLSDNRADPLIEQTENLIKEAKESLEDLKYLQDKDVLELEELDDAILDENSFLSITESAEEVNNSPAEKAKEEIEDPFVVEELDDSALDKDSHLLAQESADAIDNSTLDNQEEEIEDLTTVEELDDQNFEQKSQNLELESLDLENNLNKSIQEDDIFTIEEIDDNIINAQSNDVETNPNENIDNLESSSPETLDFSEYCFIRNQRLLESDLVAPKLNIAHLVSFFHNLSQENKILLLPILSQYFKLQEVISETQKKQLTPEIQDWLQEIIELNPEQTRKAAIWFSRYCLNPEKTMSEIQKVFDAEALKQLAANPQEKSSIEQKQKSNQEPDTISNNNKKSPNNTQSMKSLLSDLDKTHISELPQTVEREAEKKQSRKYNMNLIVPIVCLIVTFILVILGVFLTSSNSVDTEEKQSLLQEYYF
ncbi:MAG: hypothetical protein AB4372_24255 [Xenococcus sp. (in: cyanobacteria)]